MLRKEVSKVVEQQPGQQARLRDTAHIALALALALSCIVEDVANALKRSRPLRVACVRRVVSVEAQAGVQPINQKLKAASNRLWPSGRPPLHRAIHL